MTRSSRRQYLLWLAFITILLGRTGRIPLVENHLRGMVPKPV